MRAPSGEIWASLTRSQSSQCSVVSVVAERVSCARRPTAPLAAAGGDRKGDNLALHWIPACVVRVGDAPDNPCTEMRRFGMRSSACWNCAAASFCRP